MTTNPLIKKLPRYRPTAYGQIGSLIVSTFMYVELFMVAVEFLIMEGDHLHKLFPHANFHIFGVKIGGKQAFVLATALVVRVAYNMATQSWGFGLHFRWWGYIIDHPYACGIQWWCL